MYQTACSIGLAAFLLLSGSCPAQTPISAAKIVDMLTEAMAGTRYYGEAALSPDGRYVAWTESEQGKKAGAERSSRIYLLDRSVPGSQRRRVSAGGQVEHDLAWSPDSSRLAFLSDKEKEGQAQLFIADAVSGKATQATHLKGSLEKPRWAPDGRQIGLLYIENATRAPGPIQAIPAETGVIGDHVEEQRLVVIDIDAARCGPVSPADLYVYEFDWSPDGKSVVIVAAHGSGENNWYIADISTLSIDSGRMTTILKPGMQVGIPRWSPDGKTIAFVGGLMSDEGLIAGDVYTVSASGGAARNLTPEMKASAAWLTWVRSPDRILFAETIDGGTGLAVVDPEKAKVRSLWTGDESFSATLDAYGPSISVSADGTISALVRQSFDMPPEVYAGAIGEWQPMTDANREIKPLWGKTEKLHWKSDEWTIQGWLIYPHLYRRDKHYPMIVVPHGGPAFCIVPRWPGASLDSFLAYEGYFTFHPNFRGSAGQGEKFLRANVKDFGHGDLRDILSGVEAVVQTAQVDPDRLGMTGGSYGGYMTMWAVTQTNRFRAAAAVAGVSNWQSYYGENGIDQWMIPYFGASVYDDPAVYARSSPINFIKNVKTPTLVLVGEHDIECPVPQSYEFWRALKRHGVPTELVVYAGEGHGFLQPKNRRDYEERTVAWFDRYLKRKANDARRTRSN